MRNNCIFKNPNSLQEGPVSTPLVRGHTLFTNKVRANEGGESVVCLMNVIFFSIK